MAFGLGRRKGAGAIDQRGRVRKRRGRGGFGAGGPPTNCICPHCGVITLRTPGIPCFQIRCPQCGSFMTRQFLKVE